MISREVRQAYAQNAARPLLSRKSVQDNIERLAADLLELHDVFEVPAYDHVGTGVGSCSHILRVVKTSAED